MFSTVDPNQSHLPATGYLPLVFVNQIVPENLIKLETAEKWIVLQQTYCRRTKSTPLLYLASLPRQGTELRDSGENSGKAIE